MALSPLTTTTASVPSKADFESSDYDVVSSINQQFPSAQSLTILDEHIDIIKKKIAQHDEEIEQAIKGQTMIEQDGKEALDNATTIIQTLMQRIREMKLQAKKSEKTVNDITCDIKQLDNAKKNLTSAIIMLNNLHILVDSVDKLRSMNSHNSDYRQIASILAGVQDVLKQFSGYENIPQIESMSADIRIICKNLSERINGDFKSVFLLPSSKQSISKEDARLIAEACLVVSVLDDKFKNELIEWFLDLQLVEYSALFKDSQLQLSSLFGVDKRYAWFKKHLLEFEERCGYLFPPPWQMSRKMAIEFCKRTNTSLSRLMKNHPSEVTLDALIFAVTKTMAFERLLYKRFPESSESKEVPEVNIFEKLISASFDPYFGVFTFAQEQKIQKLFEKFDEIAKGAKSMSSRKQSQIFESSNKLFSQYKDSLLQCIQFNNRATINDLHDIFKRYLNEYATKILQIHIKNFNLSGISPLAKMAQSDSTTKMFTASGAAGLFHSLLRDDMVKTKIDSQLVCSVLLTADYCYESSQQLEKKLIERVDPDVTNKINFKHEMDLFNDIICCCIHLLIQFLEFGCESGFSTMVKTQWALVDTPARHSLFVDEVTHFLQTQIPILRENLKDARIYFVKMCNKFVAIFIHKYINNLFKCKLLGQGGAEQLLLDTHTLKKFLNDLPCINSNIKSAPTEYKNAVVKGMTKAEMVLKVVLVPQDPMENFLESYFKLLPDSNVVEFQKILEIKGLKKNEISSFVEAYNKFET